MSVFPRDFASSLTSVDDHGRPHVRVADRVHGERNVAFRATEVNEGRYVHPESKELFQKCGGGLNCIRYFPVYGEAIECYGYKLIASLSFTYFLSKGLGYHIMRNIYQPMYVKRWGATALEYQRFRAVSTMGWSIKPFSALLSDVFPLFGYKKRWFLTFSAVASFACAVPFSLMPATHSSAQPGVFLAFLIGWGEANLDILEEGLYSRKIRAQPSGGPAIVSAVWVTQMVAGIISAAIQGPLSDAGIPWVGGLIVAAAMVLCVPFLAFNWLREEKNREERLADLRMNHRIREAEEGSTEPLAAAAVKSPLGNSAYGSSADQVTEDANEELYIPTYCGGAIEFNKEVLVQNKRLAFFCVEMTVVIVLVAVITTLYGGYPLLATAFGGAAVLVPMLFWVFPPVVAKAGLFAFCNQVFYVDISSALENFYLASNKCLPDGPNFSYTFYSTVCGIIGYGGGLIGVVGFSYIFSKHSYRLTFVVTLMAEIIASLFDFIIAKRLNTPHVPDHYMYVFGDAVVWQAANMIAWMPMVLLLAQLCPRGSESMVYAVLVGLFNFGQTIAAQIGYIFMKWVWPVTYVENAKTGVYHCDFTNLWKLVLVAHFAFPFIILALVFVLIPSARICDDIDHNGNAVERGSSTSHITTTVSQEEPSGKSEE